MPRAAKTRAGQLARHLDGIAVWGNTNTSGDVLARLTSLVNNGREIEALLVKEDEEEQLLEDTRLMIADLERVNPALAAKMRQAMESENEQVSKAAASEVTEPAKK